MKPTTLVAAVHGAILYSSCAGQLTVTAPVGSSGFEPFIAEGERRVGPSTVVSFQMLESLSTLTDGDQLSLLYDVVLVGHDGSQVVLYANQPIPSFTVDGFTRVPDGCFGCEAAIDQLADYQFDVDFGVMPSFSAHINEAAWHVENDPSIVIAFVQVKLQDSQQTPNVELTSLFTNNGQVDFSMTESLVIDTKPLQLIAAVYDDSQTPADHTDDALFLAFNRPLFLGSSETTGQNPQLPNGTAEEQGIPYRPTLNDLNPFDFGVSINGSGLANWFGALDPQPGSFETISNTIVKLEIAAGGNLVPDISNQVDFRVLVPGHLIDYLRNDAQGLSTSVDGPDMHNATISHADVLKPVGEPNGSPVQDAIRIQMSFPITSPGTAEFWNGPNGSLVDAFTGNPTDIVVVDSRLDSNDPTVVYLTVQDIDDPNTDPHDALQIHTDTYGISTLIGVEPGGYGQPQVLEVGPITADSFVVPGFAVMSNSINSDEFVLRAIRVEAIAPVLEDGIVDAIDIVYSHPLDPDALGTPSYYGTRLRDANGMNVDIFVFDVQPVEGNPKRARLSVIDNGGPGSDVELYPDGLTLSDEQLFLNLQPHQGAPRGLLGQTVFDSSSPQDGLILIEDGIVDLRITTAKLLRPVFDGTSVQAAVEIELSNDLNGSVLTAEQLGGAIGADGTPSDFSIESTAFGFGAQQTILLSVSDLITSDGIELNPDATIGNGAVASIELTGLQEGFDIGQDRLAYLVTQSIGLVSDVFTNPECPGDVSRSGSVDLADLLITLSNFGQEGIGDADYDRDVDIEDLLMVLREFGKPCR